MDARCRDIHTTYFGDTVKKNDTYSKEEQKELARDYNLEQKAKYAENMAGKYDRMAQYSLDEDNQRMYEARSEEWEKKFEQEIKITKKMRSNVDRKLVNSKQYHDKFEKININKKCLEEIYTNSKKILEKADGSDKEYMCILDARSGNVIVSTLDRYASNDKVALTISEYNIMKQFEKEVVVIHNHSRNGRPSYADIYNCFCEKQISVSIILCHDGEIFVLDNFNRKIDVAEIMRRLYNEKVRIRLRLSEKEDIPKDMGKHIVSECKIKAVTELYRINEKKKYFSIRRM